MPRRDGEVLRLGTAIEQSSNRAAEAGGKRKRGSYTQSRRRASPSRERKRTKADIRSAAALGRAPRLERGHGDGFARIAVRPQYELERLKIRLAGVDGRLDHGVALRAVGGRAARQAQGVTKHHHVLLAP